MKIEMSTRARRFVAARQVSDVTFRLQMVDVRGSFGLVKEIETLYAAPADASHFRYVRVEDLHIFIARDIKILGPLRLDTEGCWWARRLVLHGATVPL